MSIAPGSRLGHYETIEQIGAGGKGEIDKVLVLDSIELIHPVEPGQLPTHIAPVLNCFDELRCIASGN